MALLPDGDDSFLMVTENNGLFRYNGDITPWKTDIDAELKKQRVNRAVMTNDSIFMIGTVLNGIYAIDRKGHCLWHFNLDNRLDNNTSWACSVTKTTTYGQHWTTASHTSTTTHPSCC